MKGGKEPETSDGQPYTKDAIHQGDPPAPAGDAAYNFSAYDHFALPVEIFSADGTAIYMNQACMELNGIKDKSLLIDKYNLWRDPVCIKLIGQENLDIVFSGKAAEYRGFPAPIQDVYDRGVIEEKPWQAATMTVFCVPYWQRDRFLYTVCIFDVKNIYKGKPQIIKAQEHIRLHWMEDFDLEKIARAANLSRRHLQRLFKREKLQEKLLDPSLNIAEAFATCGIENGGAWFRSFKAITGQSPSEYRKKICVSM